MAGVEREGRRMIPGFGAHYRVYRLTAALARLRDMPAGTIMTLAKAARLLGIKEAAVRTLVSQYAPTTALDRNTISAETLRQVARMAYQARKQW